VDCFLIAALAGVSMFAMACNIGGGNGEAMDAAVGAIGATEDRLAEIRDKLASIQKPSSGMVMENRRYVEELEVRPAAGAQAEELKSANVETAAELESSIGAAISDLTAGLSHLQSTLRGGCGDDGDGNGNQGSGNSKGGPAD
jgi:membrane protein involved in colicin uptake